MDLHTITTAGLEEKLKCFSCHNYLSYFPISTCSNNRSLCGRCEAPEGITCFEDEAFEALSQNFRFPCKYKSEGCREELFPKDVPQHEGNCRYRVVPCIVRTSQCKWTGSLPLRSSHCEDKHSDLILKNEEFELNLSLSEETEHLVKCDGYFLIFNRVFNRKSKVLRCTLYYHEYKSLFDSRTVQLKVLIGNTTVLSNFESTNNFMFVKMGLKSLLSNNSKVLGQILISKEDQTEPLSLSEETNRELLSLLNCVTCSQITVPPIFRCDQDTKAMCQVCLNLHIPECVFCTIRKSSYPNATITNAELEKIANVVLYPCVYQALGCPARLKWKEVSTHNIYCQYQHDVCPVRESQSCEWRGFKTGIIDHVLSDHHDFICNSPFEATIELVHCDKLVKFSGYLFRVSYLQDCENLNYLWTVQTVVDYTEEFMYEVEIFDGSNCGNRLLRRQRCSRLTDRSIVFGKTENYCYFESKQVCDFQINREGQLKFNITIFKV